MVKYQSVSLWNRDVEKFKQSDYALVLNFQFLLE